MNKTHSSALLAAVFLSIGFSPADGYAQSGKLHINPTPLDIETVREPAQDDLMMPIDVTEQKISEERALLDSIVVPEPESDYFATVPTEVSEPVEQPDAAGLVPHADNVDEYERWAAEERAKYSKSMNAKAEPSVDVSDDDMMPVTAVEPRKEPQALTAQEQEQRLQRPAEYNPEDRLSSSPELVAQVNEISSEDYGQAQPLAAQMDWNALEGNSIRHVLQGWSSSADVRLVWRSESDFAVVHPFIMRSTYERAVQKLLDQYQDSQVRPVATLHINPDTNVKTLIVRKVEGQ